MTDANKTIKVGPVQAHRYGVHLEAQQPIHAELSFAKEEVERVRKALDDFKSQLVSSADPRESRFLFSFSDRSFEPTTNHESTDVITIKCQNPKVMEGLFKALESNGYAIEGRRAALSDASKICDLFKQLLAVGNPTLGMNPRNF